MNRPQVARVLVDARLLREETSRDPNLSRVVHFTLNGWPGKVKKERKKERKKEKECVFIYRTYHIMSHGGLQFC